MTLEGNFLVVNVYALKRCLQARAVHSSVVQKSTSTEWGREKERQETKGGGRKREEGAEREGASISNQLTT